MSYSDQLYSISYSPEKYYKHGVATIIFSSAKLLSYNKM